MTVHEVAVVGIGCRFPGGAVTPDLYWELLREGRDAIADVPESRWGQSEVFSPDPAAPGRVYTARGGFLDDVAGFDAGFFGMSPREAVHVDPQQRLLLEMSFEALEDAGIPLERVAGSRTGVFVGISTHDYADIQMWPSNRALIDGHSNSGAATSLAANRVSYAFDLRGPSMIVDTACSSSLTAAHLAVASLRRGESDLALLGGVQLMLTPELTIGFCKATMLSPSCRCAAFDAGADGYARSEGGAVVVLKPLEQALADGDRVYAVIGGTAVNQDGRTTGMTVPSSDAQARMLVAALADAGVEAGRVGYVEAHGTGTPVGDPLEASALGAAYAAAMGPDRTLAIGSVKTNVGHLEAAAGMAGLVKTVLALHHRQLPASLHFHEPNHDIDFDALRLRVVTDLEPWPADAPWAGVNSFGFGGANAHVVLRQADPAPDATPAPTTGEPTWPYALLSSARTTDALPGALTSLVDVVLDPQSPPLEAVCRTAALHRTAHEHRVAAIGEDAGDLAELLTAVAAGERRAAAAVGRATATPRLAFFFSGMGPQWWGMARSLLTTDPDFADVVARVEKAIEGLAPWSLTEELLRDEDDSRVGEADLAQVTNYAVQMGLVAVLRRLGVEPDAVVGHSAGEMAAGCTAGAFSLEDGAVLAYHRSHLQARASGTGRMLAVGLPEAEVAAYLAGHEDLVALAAVNGPASTTLSGDEDALAEIAERVQAQQGFARFLPVVVPYHSALMDPIEDELRSALAFLAPTPTTVPMVSVVTGDWATGDDLHADYWWRNVRQPVRFSDGVERLAEAGCTAYLEIAPHPVLSQSVTECLTARGESATVVGALRRGEDDRTTLLRAVGALWSSGCSVDWAAVLPDAPRVALPGYPWAREHLWFEGAGDAAAPSRAAGPLEHPLLGRRTGGALDQWEASLADLPWLDDHVLGGSVVHPGAAYVEAFLAADRLLGAERPCVRGLVLDRALVLPARADVLVQVTRGERGAELHAGLGGSWERHGWSRSGPAGPPAAPVDVAAVRRRCPDPVAHDAVYDAFTTRGLHYGPAFRGIAEAWRGDGEAVARLSLDGQSTDGYLVHPALLDAAFQLLFVAAGEEGADGLFVPVAIDAVTLEAPVGASCTAVARLVHRSPRDVVGEVVLTADDGTVLVSVTGLRCRRLDERGQVEGASDWLYELRWEAPEDGSGGPSLLTGADAVELAADAVAAEQGWDRYYADVEPALQGAAAGFVWQALVAAGWDGSTTTLERLAARLEPTPDRVRHARAVVDGLVRDGWLGADGTVLRTPPDPLAALDVLVAAHPAHATDAALLRRSGSALAAVLRGELEAGDVLLDAEGLGLLEHFYRDAPASRFTNTVLSQAVHALVATAPRVRPLRVLEVGAGTGGTTAHLRRVLPADTHYVMTDASARFLEAPDGVEADLFDVERPPREQGIGSGFDLVVGANVVHATSDVARTLANLRACLAPGGRLALVEITRRLLWLDLVFGTADGWWRHDDDVRTDSALLDPDRWQAVLGGAGLTDVVALADHPADGPPGQTVLLATEPVVARAPREAEGLWAVLGDGPVAAALREALGASDDPVGAGGVVQVAEALRDGDPVEAQVAACEGLLAWAARRGDRLSQGAWVVTTGAQQAGALPPAVPGLAALWGVVRVARKEEPAVGWHLVDLPATPGPEDLTELVAVLTAGTDEDELAVHAGRRLVRRLCRVGAPPLTTLRAPEPGEGWRAELGRAGALDSLALRPADRRPPGPGEVELAVDATALNFRDVMLATGLLPAHAAEGTFGEQLLGLDVSGVVTAVGTGVDLAVGERVFGIGPGTFAGFVTTDAQLVTRTPDDLDHLDAAAVPCAFVTAVYALEEVGRLQPGETVLIHAGTGGVGLAALQVAQAAGAHVIATAGNDDKRALLRELGVEHVFDSRSTDFADHVLEVTGGRGVDVVLNSLAGTAIAAGIRTLASYGRFVEIGKRDIYEDAALDLLAFRRNLSFAAVDLDRLCHERPAVAGALLRTVAARLADGTYRPTARTVLPVAQVEEAVRLLGQARHVGKVVLDVSGTEPLIEAPRAAGRCRADGTYLVTGGTGGFGREVAAWLAGQGAGAVVLLSRTDPGDLAELRARCAPTAVDLVLGDVGDPDDLARALPAAREGRPPLRGVVHAAMVLADKPLESLDAASLRTGMHAKVGGAWALDALTAEDDLDLFVLFSSIASLLGNPGQGAYAAANASMAALAHVRRAAGRPAVAVDWGVLGSVGYVSRHADVAGFLEHQGYLPFTPAQALHALEAVLDEGRPQLMAARIDWRRWTAAVPDEATSPRLAHLAEAAPVEGADSGALADLLALPADEQHAAAVALVQSLVARVLGVAAARVDTDRPLPDLGIDSLIAVEITTMLQAELGVELPVMRVLKDQHVAGLAGVVLQAAGSAPRRAPAPRPRPAEAPRAQVPAQTERAPSAPLPSVAPQEEIDRYTGLDYATWNRAQRTVRTLSAGLRRTVSTLETEGLEHLDQPGAFVLAVNHMTLVDVPIVLTVMPRPTVVLAAPELKRYPWTDFLLSGLGNAIYVERGTGDVEAVEKGLAVLRAGGILALSPEGRRTRALERAHTGAARLAAGAGVPVVPLALWGQESLRAPWRAGRRAPVHLRVGPPIPPPAGTTTPELLAHTTEIMSRLAGLLPERYRGAYAASALT